VAVLGALRCASVVGVPEQTTEARDDDQTFKVAA